MLLAFAFRRPCIHREQYDLEVFVDVRDSLIATLTVWDASKLGSTFARNFEYSIEQAVTFLLSGTSLMGEACLLSPSEKDRIRSWTSDTPPRESKTIHELFRQQAVISADIDALLSDEGNFTYAEVDEWSNRLALYLQMMGVGKGAMVPVCFSKSPYAISQSSEKLPRSECIG